MDTLFICFNAFLLLFIFLAGGLNKIINFQDTVNSLETQINSIKLTPIFIIAIIITIIYFYIILNLQMYNKNKNLYSFLLSIISITILGIPFLVLFKNYLKPELVVFRSKRYRNPRCRAHSTTCSLSSSSLPSQPKSKVQTILTNGPSDPVQKQIKSGCLRL